MSSWGAAVPWALVIVGWWIANANANEREKRKEMRSLLDALIKVVDELERLSILYHIAGERPAPQDERQILRLITKVSDIHATAGDRGLYDTPSRFDSWRRAGQDDHQRRLDRRKAAVSLAISLKKAITLDNFATKSFARQDAESSILEDINSGRDALVNRMESNFTARFY